MSAKSASSSGPVVIKKYANRRLYNTATSSYVTLDHLAVMVKQGQDFQVVDAKTGDDITRSVLTQIIFEEENKGQNLLPIQFLRQLIGFYGDQMGNVVPRYLEVSMEAFARNQEQMRAHMTDAFGQAQPFKAFEEMTRQNMALFQEAWADAYRRMVPFMNAAPPETGAGNGTAPQDKAEQESRDKAGEQIEELKAQVAAMQKRIDQLTDKD